MNEIDLILPYPPTVNHYYKTVRTKHSIRIFIGKEGLFYREKVNSIVIDHKIKNNHPLNLQYYISDRIKVCFYIYPPDNRKRDLDNTLKNLCDSLQHAGVYTDDNQIDSILIERREVIKGGKVIVKIIKK